MLFSAELIEVTVSRLETYAARHIVVDPVMVSTSGSRLLKEGALASGLNPGQGSGPLDHMHHIG